MLRIVSGRFRGRKLYTPASATVRPTADRMKESLFNIVQSKVPHARVLDLYCGSGNLGLEAASRHAREVVFVERDPGALRLLRRNLAMLGLKEPEDVAVVEGDAIRYLQGVSGAPFGLILADPPYDAGVEEDLVRAVTPQHLTPGGVLVLQHRRSWTATAWPAQISVLQSRRYGDTVIDFLQRAEENDD